MTLPLTKCLSICSPQFCLQETSPCAKAIPKYPGIWEFLFFLVLMPALPFLPFGASLCIWWVFDLVRFGPSLQQTACKHQSLSCPKHLQAPRKSLCTRTPGGSGWCWLLLGLPHPSNCCTFGLCHFSPRSLPVFRQGAARALLARGSWSQPCAPPGMHQKQAEREAFQLSFLLYVAMGASRGDLEDGVRGGDHLQGLHVPVFSVF